jgi:hypothetical protein
MLKTTHWRMAACPNDPPPRTDARAGSGSHFRRIDLRLDDYPMPRAVMIEVRLENRKRAVPHASSPGAHKSRAENCLN